MTMPKVECPLQLKENVALRHGFSARLWKQIKVLQSKANVQIYGNPSALWNVAISIDFLRFHFGQCVDMDKKILLLWDAFSAHVTPGVQSYAKSINVVLAKVPPTSPGSSRSRRSFAGAGSASYETE